jgi:hypothetical protein
MDDESENLRSGWVIEGRLGIRLVQLFVFGCGFSETSKRAPSIINHACPDMIDLLENMGIH